MCEKPIPLFYERKAIARVPCLAQDTPISGRIIQRTPAAICIEIINVGNHEFSGFEGQFEFWIPLSCISYIRVAAPGSADHDILHVSNWILRQKGIII
jgi:hypothetical protein